MVHEEKSRRGSALPLTVLTILFAWFQAPRDIEAVLLSKAASLCSGLSSEDSSAIAEISRRWASRMSRGQHQSHVSSNDLPDRIEPERKGIWIWIWIWIWHGVEICSVAPLRVAKRSAHPICDDSSQRAKVNLNVGCKELEFESNSLNRSLARTGRFVSVRSRPRSAPFCAIFCTLIPIE